MAEMLNEEKLTGVTGGLRNIDKLTEYIRSNKALGKMLNEILSKVVVQPLCDDFLEPVYENGELVAMRGVGDLFEFVETYYDKL